VNADYRPHLVPAVSMNSNVLNPDPAIDDPADDNTAGDNAILYVVGQTWNTFVAP
jgi:hypothetical protein